MRRLHSLLVWIHGAYMDEECLQLLAGSDTIWVPTLAPTSNMIGKGRFDDTVLHKIAAGQAANIRRALALGCRIGLGSDAGAYRVLHGQGLLDEYRAFREILEEDFPDWEKRIRNGDRLIKERFS